MLDAGMLTIVLFLVGVVKGVVKEDVGRVRGGRSGEARTYKNS